MGGRRRLYKGIGYRILKMEFAVTSAIVNLFLYIASRWDEEEGSKRVLGIKYCLHIVFGFLIWVGLEYRLVYQQ